MAANPDEREGDDEELEWRFTLEDLEQRHAAEDEGADADDGDSGGNVAGNLSPDEGVEAGDIDFENAAFVLVGVVLAVLILVGFANILP